MHNQLLDIEKLIRLQVEIAVKNVYSHDLIDVGKLKWVAGFDVAYSKKYGSVAVVTLLEYPSMRLIEYGIGLGEPPISYIPGLLAFREAPSLYTAFQQLKTKPQLLVVDGHGIAHPRFAGIATHIGMALKIPSIGVAKKKLIGHMVEKDGRKLLVYRGKIVGEILSVGRRRLYISPGYGITLETATILVRSMLKGHSLPEPTYQADKISKAIVRYLDRGIVTPRQVIEKRITLIHNLTTTRDRM